MLSMRFALTALAGLAATLAAGVLAVAQTPNQVVAQASSQSEPFPSWAYPWDPAFQVPTADTTPQSLTGSTATYSWQQARDLYVAPDWHPDAHPAMPTIVATGRKPDVRACGSCHRVEGTGGPENASLAGLSAAYIAQQLADYKSGARKYSGPQRVGITLMVAGAKAMTDEEVQSAATYYSGLKSRRIIKVVEAEIIPKTYIARVFLAKSPEGGTEPLGKRIIEVPDDLTQFELRDSHASFTAYVPAGSIARGELLAMTGGADTTVACATCHGPDFKGVGDIPPIAGRSPTYIMRQLYDFKHGARASVAGALMTPTVDKLSMDDMIALSAYVATLAP